MNVRILILALIIATEFGVSALSVQSFAYERHQKTKAALPQGAPLPDIEIDENDSMLANAAYAKAKKSLADRADGDATEYYERALAALRRSNAQNSLTAKRIVLEYGLLQRAHMGTQQADALEREFGVSSESGEKYRWDFFRNCSIRRPIHPKPKLGKRSAATLTAEQSHDFSKATKTYLLSKPNGRNTVAVLRVVFKNPTLNPEWSDFDYGFIPPLSQLKISTADALWGIKNWTSVNSNVTRGQLERTYELRSTNMNETTISKKRFFLDAVFEDTKLKKYRVRSEDVSSEWQNVPG